MSVSRSDFQPFKCEFHLRFPNNQGIANCIYIDDNLLNNFNIFSKSQNNFEEGDTLLDNWLKLEENDRPVNGRSL